MFAFCFGVSDIRRGYPTRMVSRRDTFAGKISLLFGHYNGVGIYLIDAPHLYERPCSPYHDTNLYAYTDNVLRFALLGWVGCEMACGLDPFWRPDVVHAHDWHAGLAPAYLAARGRPAKSVFTVHNPPIKACFMQSIWMTSNCRGHSLICMGWSSTDNSPFEGRFVLCRPYNGGEPDLCA